MPKMDWSWGGMWTGKRRWCKGSHCEVRINEFTLVECIRTGRTGDALLALSSGADPNVEDEEGKSVLCIAISLGNVTVIRKLLEHGADISTYYPNVDVPTAPEGGFTRWIKQVLAETLFRLPLAVIYYTRFRYHPLLQPFERFFPFRQVVQMIVSDQPIRPRQFIEALLLPAELFCLLRLGSVCLRGLLQDVCNEALQSWSIQSSFVQAALLIYLQQIHLYLAKPFQPVRRCALGNEALTELLAYKPDGSEMAILLLQNGIDFGSPTQVGSQGHELLRWAVHRGYINVVEHLLGLGVPVILGLPKSKDPNRQLNYHEWYYFNQELVLVRATVNLQKDMVSLLLNHTTGDDITDPLNAALVECAQIIPPTDPKLSERNDIIKMLLNRGADPNVQVRDGRPLLSYLCGYMGEEALTLLLSAGANPGSVDSTGQTVLHHACFYTQKEDSKVIDILIDAGTPLNVLDNKGRTALWMAASWGRPHTILQLIRRGADVDLRGEGGTTPLMEVCVHNGLDIVQELLSCGADPNASTKDDTPLLAALRRKNAEYDVEIVRVLLDAGARPVLPLEFPRQPLAESVHSLKGDWTVAVLEAAQASGVVPQLVLNEALKEACVFHRDFLIRHKVIPQLSDYISLKAVKALVDAGGDVLSVVVDTCTILHAVCQATSSSGDEEETLKAILERGVSLNTQEQSSGRTPLHAAIQSSKIRTVRTLLNLGASVDIVDSESRTPLLLACQAKRREWTRDSPYDLGEVKLSTHPQYQGVRGKAALHFEIVGREREADLSMAEEDIVECLLDHGANPLMTDQAGLTPLHHACKAGNHITAGRILRGRDRLWEFIGNPAKCEYSFLTVLTVRDNDGRLPLHWAAHSGDVRVIELLLATDLNRSSSSKEYNDWSLPEEQPQEDGLIPSLLLKSSSDVVNTVDHEGFTALHCAVLGGHENAVRVLLKKAPIIDTLLASTSGHTALEIAAVRGYSRIVEILDAWNKSHHSEAWSIITKSLNNSAA